MERFRLVLVERIALAIAAQPDHLAQMLEHDQVLAPEVVERLQQDRLLDVTHHVGAPLGDLRRHMLVGAPLDAGEQLLVGDALFLRPFIDRQVEVENALELLPQPLGVPLLGIGVFRDVLGEQLLDRGMAHVGDDLVHRLVRIHSMRWSKMTLRWSFITLSNLSRFLRISKLRASTFCCAFSSALLIQEWTIASFSFSPSRCSMVSSLSVPKMRIRSSSSDRKNLECPGSPCRPERPRSWLSMRLDSWRSVPSTNSPPAPSAFSFSRATCALISAAFRSCSPLSLPTSLSSWRMRISALPPSWMSVPRPAMLVAMVIAPGTPACPMI